jgi:hypothetical protein
VSSKEDEINAKMVEDVEPEAEVLTTLGKCDKLSCYGLTYAMKHVMNRMNTTFYIQESKAKDRRESQRRTSTHTHTVAHAITPESTSTIN